MPEHSQKARKRASGGRKRTGPWRYLVGIVIGAVVTGVLIAVGVLGGGGDGDGGGDVVAMPSPRPSAPAQQANVLGSADAPVTVIEYADFQ